jgi:hypothetical protein
LRVRTIEALEKLAERRPRSVRHALGSRQRVAQTTLYDQLLRALVAAANVLLRTLALCTR